MTKNQRIVSIVFKLITAVSALIGVAICLGMTGNSFMGGATTLLYFTIQSNIWIMLVCFAAAGVMIYELVSGKDVFPNWFKIVKLVFTVSITLTGVVFCTMLAPFFGSLAWSTANVLTHVIVPLFAILDFVMFDWDGKYSYKSALFSAIPPLYYLFFAMIGYFSNWKFGVRADGSIINYPYAFLNYGGSAGVFGFSTDYTDSLFLGSFYWIIFLVIFVLGVSFIYVSAAKKTGTKRSLTIEENNGSVVD